MSIQDKTLFIPLKKDEKVNGKIYCRVLMWKNRLKDWQKKYIFVRVKDKKYPIKNINIVKGHDIGFRYNIDLYEVQYDLGC